MIEYGTTERAPRIGTRRRIIAAVTAITMLVAVAAPTGAVGPTTTTAPSSGDGGWQTASPASMGLDAAGLTAGCTYAMQPQHYTQGVVIVRGGKIVHECYAPGAGPRSWAASWSVAKTFASTLVGIAIHQGKIPNLDVSMADYIPSWVGTPKAAITLRDVITMSSGLQWNESYNPSAIDQSDVIQMGLSADELAYAESRPLTHVPGTRWSYSSGDAMLLSAVIQRATGMSVAAYAKQVLFDPLGISQVEWWQDAMNNTLTYCCLDMTTRDFARFGLLFLNQGNWNGNQVVQSQWVHDAWQTVPNSDGQYGFMWWVMTMPGVQGSIYYASGFDGQWIYVIPSLDMVVVRNSQFIKSQCPAVANPNLFSLNTPLGLNPNLGTRPPAGWDDVDFLTPIVGAATGASTESDAFPTPEPTPPSRFPDGQRSAPCGQP
ncbi:MAG: serine hydrolase, partial [Actinobacteria bacterium]|nr:serine hydrolase [Actinomycetota bacterium]